MSNTKKVEFRRSRFRDSISHVVVYASSPIQKIIGYFVVSDVQSGKPEEIWHKYKAIGGIDKSKFERYYNGASEAIAILIGEVTALKRPTPLHIARSSLLPPQSFCYLSDKEFQGIVALA
jgi:predicted transcriptional regulator